MNDLSKDDHMGRFRFSASWRLLITGRKTLLGKCRSIGDWMPSAGDDDQI